MTEWKEKEMPMILAIFAVCIVIAFIALLLCVIWPIFFTGSEYDD